MYKKNYYLFLNQFYHYCHVQLIIKKSFIIFIFIIFLLDQNKLYPSTKDTNVEDFGIISIMYHRFNENKYPSTNIRIDDFKKHIEIIENQNIEFINPKNFETDLSQNKNKEKFSLL